MLHIELGHGGYLLQKYEFWKMSSERNERGKFFEIIDSFLHVLRIFALGFFFADQVSRQNTSPIYSYFSCSDSPYTAISFFDPPPENYPHPPINK